MRTQHKVASEARSRQKKAQKRSAFHRPCFWCLLLLLVPSIGPAFGTGVNEHFKPFFNDGLATVVVMLRSLNILLRGFQSPVQHVMIMQPNTWQRTLHCATTSSNCPALRSSLYVISIFNASKPPIRLSNSSAIVFSFPVNC